MKVESYFKRIMLPVKVDSLSIDQVYGEFYSNVRSSLEPSSPYNQSPYELLCISKVAYSSSSLVHGCIQSCIQLG
jgi:hypothetical protein